MKKSIILVTMLPVWSMNNGSGGKALFNTISEYLNQKYEVFLVTNQENDYSKIEHMKKENVFYVDTKWYTDYSQQQKNSKFTAYRYFCDFEKKSYQAICQILEKIGTSNTILYAYEVNAVKACKKAAKKYKIKLVTRFQGTIMSQYKNNLYYRIRKYPHIQALSTKSDLVIMTDDGTQGDKVLDECLNDSKRLFIRNGVNILDSEIKPIDVEETKERFGIPKDTTVLLVCSRLEGWKKVDRSILAFHELKNKEQYNLIILGEGPERKKLENLVKELNLSHYIKFMGAVKNEEVKIYMQLADIFLSFYDLSNVGNPLLEALCLKKPIITYDVGDTNKIIDGKNGILLKDVSPQNIAATIENINQPEILQEYSKQAEKYSKEHLYSWKKRMEIEKKEVDKLFNERL